MAYDPLAVAALARTASAVSNEALLEETVSKQTNVSNSLGITFSGNTVTGNTTIDRLDDLELRQVPSLGDDHQVEYNDVGVLVSTTSTITLPIPKEGYEIVIKKIDNVGTNTINPNSSETVEGQTSYILTTQWQFVRLLSDGVNWYVIGV